MLVAETLARSSLVEVTRVSHAAHEPHEDPDGESVGLVSLNRVASGRFLLETNDGCFPLSAGDLFLTWPGQPLRYRHPERPDDVCVAVAFDEELARAFSPPARVERRGNRLRYLYGRLEEAESSPLDLETRAVEALAAAVAEGEDDGARPYSARQLRWYGERIDQVRARLEAAWDGEAPSLAALGREVGMSPFHLARLFRELVGRPPHRYLVDLRLARAASLLARGARVTEACHASGFQDLPHFTRTFRRRFGVVPSAYRG